MSEVAALFTMAESGAGIEGLPGALGALREFDLGLYECMVLRADALFEVVQALCTDAAPVASLADLSLALAAERGHGAWYDALARGAVDQDALFTLAVGSGVRRSGRRLQFAVDVSNWLRPEAHCSPGRLYCHVSGCSGGMPGWQWSWLVALEPGRSSWVVPLEVRRLEPDGLDANEMAAQQIRAVWERLLERGAWVPGDPVPVFFLDAGYSGAVLQDLLVDVPAHIVVRLKSRQVFYGRPPQRLPGAPGRTLRHGTRLGLQAPEPAPDETATWEGDRYGQVHLRAWQAYHPELFRGYDGYWLRTYPKGTPLPIRECTVIHVTVERLPRGTAAPASLWLWHHGPEPLDPRTCWSGYLRRFDIEHFFRFVKGQLGWTTYRPRGPEQAARWTALVMAGYLRLHLARGLVRDQRRAWESRPRTASLSPVRVRRGFPRLHRQLSSPAQHAKPSHPGPGRPPGRTSTPAQHHPTHRKPKRQPATKS